MLDYLNSLAPEQDDELLLMMDAYDIQMQLPTSTLTRWHYEARDAAQQRIVAGRVGALRREFAEASGLIEDGNPQHAPEHFPDDGAHWPDNQYGGSDQSVFANMYGRQEWVRERLRLKYARPGTKARTSQIFGTCIDDAVSPSFTHEKFDPDLSVGNPCEFGIYLDVWSHFGDQTMNSEWDGS